MTHVSQRCASSSSLVHSRSQLHKAAMKRTLDDEERNAFEELLRATKRVKSLVLELLCADDNRRQAECTHAWERLYSEGCRDNNEYDLVCRHCGQRA